jgi:hypothetical protein
VLLLDRIERQVLADRQVAATFLTAGAKGVTLPDFEERRALFDAALVEEPRERLIDSDQMELRRALGVA